MAKIGSCLTGVASTARKDDLADVDTGDKAVGLAEGTTHTSLKSIGTGARQHLVDTDDVEGVGADAEVETFLSGSLDHVPVQKSVFALTDSYPLLCVSLSGGVSGAYALVGADTGGFERL